MKMYVCHSTAFDFENELYVPLKQAFGDVHEIILPHEMGNDINSKSAIQSSDIILAEVSYPSTGQGIEIGWADDAGVNILCFYKSGSKPSGALHHISSELIRYEHIEDMLSKLSEKLG